MAKSAEPKQGTETPKPIAAGLPILVRVTRADRLRIATLLGRQ